MITTMRPILIGLLATSALASSMAPLECDIDPDNRYVYSLCDRSVVTKCLSDYVESSTFSISTLGQCLVTGGCSEVDADLTSKAIRNFCGFPAIPPKDDTLGDLRKRQKNKGTTSAASEVTDAKTTAADPKTSKAQTTAAAPSTSDSSSDTPSSTDSPSSAAPSTTDTPSSTDSPSTSATLASTTPSSASSTPPTTMTSTTSSPTSSTTGPLVCLTTSHMSTTWCITSTSGASIGSTCIPTFTPIISCAPGLICQTQAAGGTICMVRQSNLTTSGLVVTIIFATVLFAFFASLFGMCIKSRRTSRRQAIERKAALIAGTKARNMRDVESSNNYARGRMGSGGASVSEDHLPLMAAQGPSGGNGNSRDASADRRPVARRVPSGTYQDVVASRTPAGAPSLHPGLMEMGADDDDIAYRGGRGGR